MSETRHPELEQFIKQGRAILRMASIPEMWRAFEEWDNTVGDWLTAHYPHSGYVAEWTGMVADGLYTGPEETEVGCLNETVRRRIEWLGWLQRKSSARIEATSVGERVSNSGYLFEREVAAIYRALGARVEQDVVLAGNQIDIVVEEVTSSGMKLRTAVECKAYARPVGVDVVMRFASLIGLFKQRSLVDRGTLVTSQGFTPQARAAGKEMALELLEFADLQQRAQGRKAAIEVAEAEIDEARRAAATAPGRAAKIFVVMPFASEFDDVYLLGIREVAEKLGFAVDRADDIEHNENVLEVVQERIRECAAVIADISGRNPNVFYEVGYAHAVSRPTILLCRKGENVPFDLQSINYISYVSIVELRDRLERRLRALLAK